MNFDFNFFNLNPFLGVYISLITEKTTPVLRRIHTRKRVYLPEDAKQEMLRLMQLPVDQRPKNRELAARFGCGISTVWYFTRLLSEGENIESDVELRANG